MRSGEVRQLGDAVADAIESALEVPVSAAGSGVGMNLGIVGGLSGMGAGHVLGSAYADEVNHWVIDTPNRMGPLTDAMFAVAESGAVEAAATALCEMASHPVPDRVPPTGDGDYEEIVVYGTPLADGAATPCELVERSSTD